MSTQYIVWMNERECGPVDLDALKAFEVAGQINEKTNVRFSESADWLTWKEVRQRGEKEIARLAPPEPQTPYVPVRSELEVIRDKVRAQSAYPTLRVCLIILLVLASVGLAISAMAILNGDETRPLGITGAAASLGTILSTLILGVLLDIADASLRKIE